MVNRIDVSIEPEQTVPPQGMALPTSSRRPLADAAVPRLGRPPCQAHWPASRPTSSPTRTGDSSLDGLGDSRGQRRSDPAMRPALAPLPGVATPIHRLQPAWR